jgi:hypothetical protein
VRAVGSGVWAGIYVAVAVGMRRCMGRCMRRCHLDGRFAAAHFGRGELDLQASHRPLPCHYTATSQRRMLRCRAANNRAARRRRTKPATAPTIVGSAARRRSSATATGHTAWCAVTRACVRVARTPTKNARANRERRSVRHFARALSGSWLRCVRVHQDRYKWGVPRRPHAAQPSGSSAGRHGPSRTA